jgi:hypothetical protein
MPVNLWSMAGDVINGKWYIVGGSDPTTNYKNTVWIYDPAANTWTSGPAAPTARCCAAAATINGQLYVVGGADSTGNLSTLEVFNPGFASFQSTLADITNSLQLGLINSGIANALSAKIQAASQAAARGQNGTALNNLQAFENLVRAQASKHITGIAIPVLTEDGNSLITQLQ